MFLHISTASLESAIANVPADQPVFMLNLLRYRDQALYRSDTGLPACSGREAYFTRYVPAFRKLAAGQGIAPHWLGSAKAVLVGAEDERWDDVALVRYPDFATFRRIASSAEYRCEAAPHRLAALTDSRLIATTEAQLPG
jgi:hypothetical protein